MVYSIFPAKNCCNKNHVFPLCTLSYYIIKVVLVKRRKYNNNKKNVKENHVERYDLSRMLSWFNFVCRNKKKMGKKRKMKNCFSSTL
jgi:hypothetical protein